jgi:hypothetical protein
VKEGKKDIARDVVLCIYLFLLLPFFRLCYVLEVSKDAQLSVGYICLSIVSFACVWVKCEKRFPIYLKDFDGDTSLINDAMEFVRTYLIMFLDVFQSCIYMYLFESKLTSILCNLFHRIEICKSLGRCLLGVGKYTYQVIWGRWKLRDGAFVILL